MKAPGKAFLLSGMVSGLFVFGMLPLFAQNTVPAASARSVADLEKRVEVVEARLGRNVTTPTATNNLERRLDDLEDRIKDLETKVKDLEKLERRVRELERKR